MSMLFYFVKYDLKSIIIKLHFARSLYDLPLACTLRTSFHGATIWNIAKRSHESLLISLRTCRFTLFFFTAVMVYNVETFVSKTSTFHSYYKNINISLWQKIENLNLCTFVEKIYYFQFNLIYLKIKNKIINKNIAYIKIL